MYSYIQHIIINMDFLKTKLDNILHCEQFCGMCMEKTDNMTVYNGDIEIFVDFWKQKVTLKDIIQEVFSCFDNILASTQVCNSCMDKLLQSYIFIRNTKYTSKLIMNYVNGLNFKSVDIYNHLVVSANPEMSNVVIVSNTDYCFNGLIINDKYNFKKKESLKKAIENVTNVNQDINDKMFQCKICFKSFKTEPYLKAHYKVHSKVICKICHDIITDGELVDHLKTNHEDTAHICHICNVAYYSANALKTHETICHEVNNDNPQCVMCMKNVIREELRSHNCKFYCSECHEMPCIHYKYLMSYREQILNHASSAKCLDCDYVCRKKDILLGHVNRKHLDRHPYSCDKCGQQFYSKPLLKAHIYRFHQDSYICEFCDGEFNSESSYENHKKCCELITREFICDKCTSSFGTLEELSAHAIRRHTEEFPCGLRKKTFFKKSKRKEHFVKVHKGVQISNKKLHVECAVCEENFDTKVALVQHMRVHGPNVKYPCRICNTEYETLRKLRAHSQKHVGPFATCDVCEKQVRQVLLAKHMASHDKETIVTCETCGKSFQNSTLLKYHQKEHLDSIPCPKCNKLINPAKLRRHLKGHILGEDPVLKEERRQKPNLKCEMCDYMTWNNILLECHMNRHHLKIKPYVCHICSKNFIGKHLLKKHLETHTINKSVLCTVCGKSFANKTCLKMHLRLHTGEKPYSCDICGENFTSSSIMNVHKLKKHSDKRTACPLCSSKFHTVRDLRRHVIKVHWKLKKKFDPRELKGLEDHYHLFHDGRRVKVDEKEIDFYMPCE